MNTKTINYKRWSFRFFVYIILLQVLAFYKTYTFTYGDDAFFEYDLKKGQAYKFIFEHRNFGDKSKQEPRKTYLCGQKRSHLVMVK